MPRTSAAFALVAVLALASFAGFPSGVAQADDAWTLKDGQGDVTLGFMNPAPPGAATPVSDPVDIVAAGILGEDELGLTIFIDVVNIKDNPAASVGFGGGYSYTFQGALEGTQVSYSLRMYVYPPGDPATPPSGSQPIFASFCFAAGGVENPNPYRGDCQRQNVEALVNWDDNRVQAYVSKDALRGLDPAEGAPRTEFPPALAKGSQLGKIVFASDLDFPPLADRAPDDGTGGPYAFRTDAANTKVRLALELPAVEVHPQDPYYGPQGFFASMGNPNEFSVSPGTPTLVPLRVENLMRGKRIVNLSAHAEGSDKFDVQIVPQIQVNANDVRVVTLIVNTTGAAVHRDTANILVQGRSLGVVEPEYAALRLRVVASVQPGPDHSTLYFHGDLPEWARGPFSCVWYCPTETWMNTLREDPDSGLEDGLRMDNTFFGPDLEFTKTFLLDTPLTDALLLDPKVPITATLAFQTDLELSQADVGIDVSTAAGRLVATGVVSGPVKSDSPVTVTAPPLVDQTRIGAEDGSLVVRVTLRTSGLGPALAEGFSPNFVFVPKTSSIVFPFIVDPLAQSAKRTGPAFITLHPLSDLEDFVNPGRTAVFNASVVNEGFDADEARVTVAASDPSWNIAVLPGAAFTLSAGDGAIVSFLVRAPPEAKEGSQLQLTVNASSAKDPAAVSTLHFLVIVTTGADIPDEAAGFQADADSSAKVANQPSSDTPGPGLSALMACLLLAAGLVWLRRRA